MENARSDPPPPSQDSASLLKRLAGPSSGKAGLAKDQTEINRIIAEASKGSKFYENEKRKDKQLTERIRKILKERDEVSKGVDISKLEQAVDQIIADLEAYRDLSQHIIHVDMDAFYASVELLDNPDLAGKPFAVSGGGVLTTASYAARQYGVRSGMAAFIARKLCPELILVKNTFSRYSEMSRKVMSVFKRYDPNMMAAGCDEGYLNITPYCAEHGINPDECVSKMRAEVFEETKLTVSAGIAPNKMLAKICSDKNKPNGQYHLPFERSAVMAFTHDLSIRKIPGIGRVHERLLESIGVQTCGDIYKHRATLSLMDKTFGLHSLLRVYLGIASNVVQPGQREERKSIGAERTFSTLAEKDKILQKLDEVAEELESDMEHGGWAGKTVTLKYKLDTYQVFTRAKTFERWITTKEDLLAAGHEILRNEWPLRLRLIGLRMTKLKDLKAPESSSGIKRFLKPSSKAEESTLSPSKRRKLEHHGDQLDLPIFDDDQDEPSTFFIGDDDEEYGALPGSGDVPIVEIMKPKSLSSAGHDRIQSLDTSDHPTRAMNAALLLTCPICARTIETDNGDLNAHIDFCLSKSAIREATKETMASPDRRDGPADSPAKPSSKGWDSLFKPTRRGSGSGGVTGRRKGARSR